MICDEASILLKEKKLEVSSMISKKKKKKKGNMGCEIHVQYIHTKRKKKKTWFYMQ